MGWLWLAGVVETKDQQCYCLERVLRLTPQNEVIKNVLKQLKSDGPDAGAQSTYFLGGKLPPEDMTPYLRSLSKVFDPQRYKAICIDRKSSQGHSPLLNICQKIYLNNFSIFDLSVSDPNTYLELGIALGFNRPLIVTAHTSSDLIFQATESIIRYRDDGDLTRKLSQRCEQGFPPTDRPARNYCYFCNRICDSMTLPPDENRYLVLNASKMLWRNVMRHLDPHLSKYDLHPLFLTERVTEPFLCDIRRKVVAAQFTLGHLGSLSNLTSYLALGIAIGSRTPWLLLSRSDERDMPADLRSVGQINYEDTNDLQVKLTNSLSLFLGKVLPDQAAQASKTTMLSLPFWIELEDWINRVKHATRAPEATKGALRLVQYQDARKLSEYPIARRGLSFGRGADCDVVLDDPSVSTHHFRIIQGRSRTYFIEDLGSKNGTFLNGARLLPNKKVEIQPKDTIRIPGASFLTWDERPLPQEKVSQTIVDTDLLPPILKIDIPDVVPPAYLNTWDHALKLIVALPNRPTHSTFEVQGYYPMGKIIDKLVDLLGLPSRDYCFLLENQPIDNDETPLSAGIKRNDILTLAPQSQAPIRPGTRG